ncbi:MAG: helix-turn-helix domain-containing protein [Thermoguttaceae bacterium]|nr:helix-turn-helix domain-containing protein [Thermoguttaceae bacterium]
MLTNNQKIGLALDKIRDSLSDVEKAMTAEDGAEGKGITLADKVMMLRERGLTQTEIAKEIGASQSRVSNILNSFKEWKEKK